MNKKGLNRREFLARCASTAAGCMASFALPADLTANEKKTGNQIAIIIDDIGYRFSQVDRFFKIGIPITFSVLPKLDNTLYLSSEIYFRGYEVMLHQPMEPRDLSYNPGPGALYVGYEKARTQDIIDSNLEEVPYAIGINNHMGSRYTESGRDIKRSLNIIKDKSLFFVDSLTSYRSVAYSTAKSLHMTTARRNVFLDNVRNEYAITQQLNKLKRIARLSGKAMGIGHPFPETARAIKRFSEKEENCDCSFVYVSSII